MKIELINMKKFIVANRLQEVTNPITFEKGSIPTNDGVLSTDIFGVSMKERKRTFAYVKLHGHFFHPFVYKVLKRLNRKFEDCVNGNKKFIIKNGDLVEDENGSSGLEFLYKNWDQFNFKKNESAIRNSRIDLLKFYDRDTLFTQHWLIIPPFYRDVNLSQGSEGKASHHEINDKYSKLIRLTSNLSGSGFDILLNQTSSAVQNVLVDIYDMFKQNLEKKYGLQRKALLGKSIDYGARLVISAPRFVSDTAEDSDVTFYRTGVPLSMTCAIFTPFIINAVRRFFERELAMSSTYKVIDKDGKEKFIELKDPSSHFNEDYIMKKLKRFIKSPADRYEVVYLPTVDKEYENKYAMAFRGRYYDKENPETESPLMGRPMTWTDVFYITAYDVIERENKMVWITRYPLLDYFGMLTTYVHIHSTNKTKPVYIDDNVYPYYPDINVRADDAEISTSFIDTLTLSNLYLAGLGGDYDGDQVSIRGVFSQEAQAESEEIMHGKANVLNIYGGAARTSTNEAIQTVFMMTRRD